MLNKNQIQSTNNTRWQGRRFPLLMFGAWFIACLLVVGVSLGIAGESLELRQFVTVQLEKAHIIDPVAHYSNGLRNIS